MKKIVLTILLLSFIFTAVSCGQSTSESELTSNQQPVTVTPEGTPSDQNSISTADSSDNDISNDMLQKGENFWSLHLPIPAYPFSPSAVFQQELKETETAENEHTKTVIGRGSRSFDTWQELEDFIGSQIWNPLEEDASLAKVHYTGTSGVTPGAEPHSIVFWTCDENRTLQSMTVQAGYSAGSNPVILYLYLFSKDTDHVDVEGPLANQTVETETSDIEGVGTVASLHNSYEGFDGRHIYFVRDNILYTVSVMGQAESDTLNIMETVSADLFRN